MSLQPIQRFNYGFFNSAVEANLTGIFGNVNEQVGTIASQVAQTPQGWNINIFNLIPSLAETVIMPIAAIIITYVLVMCGMYHHDYRKELV